jgi:hypothetical protein
MYHLAVEEQPPIGLQRNEVLSFTPTVVLGENGSAELGRVLALVRPDPRLRTSTNKLRIELLRFGTGRQKMVL